MVLSGREKTTIFLSILGADVSSRVLRYLPDELADLIAAGINHLPTPSPDALSEILDEYQSFLAIPETASPSFLNQEKAPPVTRVENKPAPERPAKKPYTALMYERPQMAAFLILALPEEERADALNALPKEKANIEELMSGLKVNLLRAKLEENLKKVFTGKIF